MANDRTLGAKSLSSKDKNILETAKKIGDCISGLISDPLAKADFIDSFSKVKLERDAGLGMGGGKLQRDALCTRGKTDKSPLSNRNLRWHPMVVARECPPFAKPVEAVIIDKTGSHPELRFKVAIGGTPAVINGKELFNLEDVYCAAIDSWKDIADELSGWTRDDWGRNRCVIHASEYSDSETALKTYLSLAVSVALERYEVEHLTLFEILSASLDSDWHSYLGSLQNQDDLRLCPLCRRGFSEDLDDFRSADRIDNWQAPWSRTKRSEGDDSSLQLMHVNPLVENKIMHNPQNVRYGHRWCNITMTDHTIEETLTFFDYVSEQHK